MKKILMLVMAVMLNCSSAWAENNLLDYDWWRHATVADVKKEIANGADVNAKDNIGRTALMLACHSNNTEIVKALIDAGADINAKDNNGETAWYKAVVTGHYEIEKMLEKAGADTKVDVKINKVGIKDFLGHIAFGLIGVPLGFIVFGVFGNY